MRVTVLCAGKCVVMFGLLYRPISAAFIVVVVVGLWFGLRLCCAIWGEGEISACRAIF